ncbi:MAG: hypothetical protein KGI19_08925 [Thaumarchaeota archaeon]|nr:hypothetical protein [Nitrososphaerota archaeon]
MSINNTNMLVNRAPKRGQVKERILRVLLNQASNPNEKKLTKYKIMKLAKANISWVIELLKKLEKQGLVDGTMVKDYRGLIIMWKNIRTKPDVREYMVRDILDLLRKTNMKYALTTYAAENLVQKYLFTSRIDFYIKQNDLPKWHNMLSEKGLVGKGNVRVLATDEHVFYNSSVREGLTVVSIPQLIVDLMIEGAVGGEAADMLLEKEMKNSVS